MPVLVLAFLSLSVLVRFCLSVVTFALLHECGSVGARVCYSVFCARAFAWPGSNIRATLQTVTLASRLLASCV